MLMVVAHFSQKLDRLKYDQLAKCFSIIKVKIYYKFVVLIVLKSI